MLIVTEEALEAFTLHMDRLVATHGEIVVVNLLDSEGKEAPLGDEFAKVVSLGGSLGEGRSYSIANRQC